MAFVWLVFSLFLIYLLVCVDSQRESPLTFELSINKGEDDGRLRVFKLHYRDMLYWKQKVRDFLVTENVDLSFEAQILDRIETSFRKKGFPPEMVNGTAQGNDNIWPAEFQAEATSCNLALMTILKSSMAIIEEGLPDISLSDAPHYKLAQPSTDEIAASNSQNDAVKREDAMRKHEYEHEYEYDRASYLDYHYYDDDDDDADEEYARVMYNAKHGAYDGNDDKQKEEKKEMEEEKEKHEKSAFLKALESEDAELATATYYKEKRVQLHFDNHEAKDDKEEERLSSTASTLLCMLDPYITYAVDQQTSPFDITAVFLADQSKKKHQRQCLTDAKAMETRHVVPPSRRREEKLYMLNAATLSKSMSPSLEYANMVPYEKTGRYKVLQSRFIVYQTRFARTGGTTALNTLYLQLLQLWGAARVLLCDEENHASEECTQPTDRDIVITGEWCHGVLQDYSMSAGHKGRGLQYHLGFHHRNDICSGHVAISDSQYLGVSLSSQRRVLGAYFLGCPMSPLIEKAAYDMMRKKEAREKKIDVSHEEYLDKMMEYVESVHTNVNTKGNQNKGDSTRIRGQGADMAASVSMIDANGDTIDPDYLSVGTVAKENLIIVDPDMDDDYPPITPLEFSVPVGTRVVYARDIPHHELPLMLARAKVVLDLAMPGPERLSSEGILLGAVPIISDRWNGASPIDFIGLRRVDPTNGTDITQAVTQTLLRYREALQEKGNLAFLNYVMSLSARSFNTLEIVSMSAQTHFVIYTASLQDESLAVFQVMSLLYLYPMCSIDLYVTDVLWFYRHHYAFVSLLQDGGYLREDLLRQDLTPDQKAQMNDRMASQKALVSIKWNKLLDAYLTPTEEVLSTSALIPSWSPLMVILPLGQVPESAQLLIDLSDRLFSDTSSKPALRASFTMLGESIVHKNQSQVMVLAPDALLTAYVADNIRYTLRSLSSLADSEEYPSPLDAALEATVDLEIGAVVPVDTLVSCSLSENSKFRSSYHAKPKRDTSSFYSKLSNKDEKEKQSIDMIDSVTFTSGWQGMRSFYCHLRGRFHGE